MNSQKSILILLFFSVFVIPVFSGITLFASDNFASNSLQTVIRQPDSTFVQTYRAQKEFSYSGSQEKALLWQQFWNYLKKRFGHLSRISSALPWIFKIIIGLILLFTLFIIITQTKLYKIFYTEKEIESNNLVYSMLADPSINFDLEIRKQVEEKQFRLAIRLLYLKGIQQLRNKNFIQFAQNKTNVDYLRDLPNANLRDNFKQVTTIYNHVWYGENEIEETQYSNFEKHFTSLFIAIDVQE